MISLASQFISVIGTMVSLREGTQIQLGMLKDLTIYICVDPVKNRFFIDLEDVETGECPFIEYEPFKFSYKGMTFMGLVRDAEAGDGDSVEIVNVCLL